MNKRLLESIVYNKFNLNKQSIKSNGVSRYYSEQNEDFYLFVNFNYNKARVEYGLKYKSGLDEHEMIMKFGIDTDSSNLRECLYFSEIENANDIIEIISAFFMKYKDLSKEELKRILKDERNRFRNKVHSCIKKLGFSRKYNTWELIQGKYKIQLYLGKSRYSDLYDFYCWVYDSEFEGFQYVRERMRCKENGEVFFDWILDRESFLKCLDEFILLIVTPLLTENMERLPYFKMKKE